MFASEWPSRAASRDYGCDAASNTLRNFWTGLLWLAFCRAPMTTAIRAMVPPANALLLRVAAGGRPPTLSQYFLNPLNSHRMVESEIPNNLLRSEFRVAFPNRTDAGSCSSASVQLPAPPVAGQ